MRRRQQEDEPLPDRLATYRPRDWPGGYGSWRAARIAYAAAYPDGPLGDVIDAIFSTPDRPGGAP